VDFSITINAADAYGNTVTGFTDTADLSDRSGTINPVITGNFAAGTWTGDVSVNSYGGQANNFITATSGLITGDSANFNVADYPIRNMTQEIGYTAAQGIQAAINAAESGNVIEVVAGTYNENLTINKNLTLQAPDGPTATKLLPDSNTVISIGPGNSVTIYGFDIDAILADGIYINGNITAGTTVLIQNCVIRQNERHGIYVAGNVAGELVVDGNIIAQNWQSGIYVGGEVTGTVTITDNTIGEINDGTWNLTGKARLASTSCPLRIQATQI
jgi:hypothetical protein